MTLGDTLILYSRTGCHLCQDAEAHLAALGQAFTRVDIAGDAELERLYGWDVPVLTRGGVVIAKGVLGSARLRRVLGL
ncbi:glutaredoxin family protein [Deinococcus irradiatisoli]|uniref:Glutaredoxin family protein n=1 Tax=Deinococcus irradiatisoli TaxID=2202254 RepID=A0A2Z3JMA7_9DEIO|nr:glutaredoxin family protein [Deinococcus irradiatisoli]AWN24641.1 glutaredoxin family protein [Deinococcus irradiatisoli]